MVMPMINARKSYTIRLYNGTINKQLLVNYGYTFIPRTYEEKYPTVKITDKGNVVINHSYSLTISEGFDKARLFVPGRVWFQFVTLLEKSVKRISENLYELFPDLNKTEFDIDARTLEIYQTEKACSTAGLTMIPTVYVNESHECFPAIKIITTEFGSVVVPFEDAISLSTMISKIDPITYGMNIMSIMDSL